MPEMMKLKNGMRVHLVPVEGTKATSVLTMVNVGSRYETPEINGAAHFIEHLMFKGTKRRPSTLDISKELDKIGADYNAFTSKHYTGYYIKAGKDNANLAIDLLHDMMFHSVYDEEEMDKERNVIIEEINMYHDSPMRHVEEILESAMFEGSTLGWEIAGSHETMKNMSREQVIAFRDAHYIPSRTVVVVAGNIDDDIKGQLEETFGTVAKRDEQPEPFKPFEGLEDKGPRVAIENKDTEQVQLALGFPGYGVDDDRLPAVKLLSMILGGTMSSRLFITVREKNGLAYFVRSSHGSYNEVGSFTIRAGLDKNRLADAMDMIRAEIDKMVEEGVTDEELADAKTHVRGKTLLKMEDSSSQARWYAKQELLLNETKTVEERMAEIDAVTAEDIKAVAKDILNEDNLTIAAIGPYEDEQAFRYAANLE